MSATAGRVALVPKGAYIAGTTYNRLDIVANNNRLYIAKKTTTAEPTGETDTDDYMFMLASESSTIDEIESLIGTTSISSIGDGTLTGAVSALDSRIIPIAKGGTNASTALEARNNLGLGTAAVKATTSTIASGSTDLPTSEAVNSAIVSAEGTLESSIATAKSEAISANRGLIGTAWNSSTAYVAGDYVIYNDKIWKCLVANTGTTPSEGANWTATTTSGELETLNNNLTNRPELLFDSATWEDVTISGGDALVFSAPNKNGYTCYVIKVVVAGSWSDKYAVIVPWNNTYKAGIRNDSTTAYTWTITFHLMYVKN